MRQPAVAGSFYAAKKEELEKEIGACIGAKTAHLGKAKALIVPHAGYYFSGRCAMKAYDFDLTRRLVILGPNHYGYSTGLSEKDWQTPLGIVKSDKVLLKRLREVLQVNEEAHRKEHSIEVQLPLLQSKLKEFTFCPVSLGTDIDPYSLGQSLRFLLDEDDVTIIVSSDFTHFGKNYGYVPFKDDIKENLKTLDMQSIRYIQGFDYDGFNDHLKKTGTTICGYMGILVLLSLFKGTRYKAELVDYYTSGDVLGDFRNSVSYASIVIR
ncbi:MAG: AmmeMemoRadiSam system protein B [Candidatus Woesearchaeota archaeon]|nr:AmmeMemoRadiSam system protein B [Candidatus Woesearchaeota archaeon]